MIRISGVTPSGHVHLGNYLGAIRHWAADASDAASVDGGADCDLYFVSNLHAMTLPYNPAVLRNLTRETYAILLAAGLPAESVFVQSDLFAEHAALTWILECVCTFGEARRMTQFKEKSAGTESVRLGLLTYPTLMAADILLHGAGAVPVGDDQRQHVELARALAKRFNGEYGEAFVVPRAVVPRTGARIMDLARPDRKMAKSTRDSAGTVFVMDPPDLVHRKVSRAVTDSRGAVRYDPAGQPGVANLLDILACARGDDPRAVADSVGGYAELKRAAAAETVEVLRPVRERATALLDDPAELDRLRVTAAKRAGDAARPRLAAARRLAGI